LKAIAPFSRLGSRTAKRLPNHFVGKSTCTGVSSVTPDRATKWTETRAQGQWSFVWRVGILRWGLIMFGTFVGMQTAQHPDRILFILALNVPLCLCGGFSFGLLTWLMSEWNYKRHLAKNATGMGGRAS